MSSGRQRLRTGVYNTILNCWNVINGKLLTEIIQLNATITPLRHAHLRKCRFAQNIVEARF